MAFYSQHAPRIWEDLYNALVPDHVTQNPEYLRIFGTYASGHKEVDKMLSNNLTHVKIPIIKMLEYFDNGIEIQIPKRESMITIHQNIEKYLGEWREHIRVAVNSDLLEHKELVINLEKLSKMIYGKAYPSEVNAPAILGANLGLLNPLSRLQIQTQPIEKADYSGIGQLIRQKTRNSRY